MAAVLDLTNRPRHTEKAHRPGSAAQKKPDRIRVNAPVSPGYFKTPRIIRAGGLHTACEEAKRSLAQQPAMTKKIRGER
jgi:lipoyl synthase